MSLESLKEDTYRFNWIAGNDKKISKQSFLDQFAVLDEEVKEIFQGLENNDLEEVTDGVVDTIVVALGLLQKLETMGVDTQGVMLQIGDNNMQKFPLISDLREQSVVEKTVKKYKEKGITVDVSTSPTGSRWVFKNQATGKILKPFGFEAVDLSSCIPEGVSFE